MDAATKAFLQTVLAVLFGLVLWSVIKHHWSARPLPKGHHDHFDPEHGNTYDPELQH